MECKPILLFILILTKSNNLLLVNWYAGPYHYFLVSNALEQKDLPTA